MGSSNVLSMSPVLVGDSVGRAVLWLAFGALVLALIAFQFAKVRALYGGDGSTERRRNCPSCGARIPADADACEHCGEPVRRDGDGE
ncbi:MAG: zinc-ribbon domain-containing protein [Haloplanus sp.]